MPAPVAPTRRMLVAPPPGASHWSIWRCETSGGNRKRTKCQGEPEGDGRVPEEWPVDQFSVATVLARWGEGRYRVEWYDKDDALLKGKGQLFDVANPKARRAAAKRATLHRELDAVDPLPADVSHPSADGTQSLGIFDVLSLLRAEAQAQREAAQVQAERDRSFMTQLITALGGSRQTQPDADLLRRELNQTIREELFRFRQEQQQQRELDDLEDPDEPDDPRDPPRDLDEAGNRIGLALLGEIEQKAPELLNKFLPQLLNGLKGQGFQPSAELEAQIAGTHANGRRSP